MLLRLELAGGLSIFALSGFCKTFLAAAAASNLANAGLVI